MMMPPKLRLVIRGANGNDKNYRAATGWPKLGQLAPNTIGRGTDRLPSGPHRLATRGRCDPRFELGPLVGRVGDLSWLTGRERWRWSVLARPLGFNLPQRRYLRLYFEGMFFSLCLPSSIGGDVFKAYRLANDSAGRVLAGCTVLADRATGLIGLAVIGLTALAGRSFALSPWVTVAVGIALLAAALVAVSVTLKIINWLTGHLRPGGRASQFATQLVPYHSRPEVFRRAVGWGLLVQCLNVVMVIEIGQAMGLAIPLAAYCVAVPAVAMLTILPVSISGVGVREGGLAWMLGQYGLAPAMGVTLGLLWFLVTVTGGLIGGAIYLWGASNLARASRVTQPVALNTPIASDRIPTEPQRQAA